MLMDRMGYKEGEVISGSPASLLSARRKSGRNFGIRKRAAEYDDVEQAA
jgi:preprotein translocase subunit SecA